MDDATISLLALLIYVVLFGIALIVYLLPAIISFSRSHKYKWPITIITVLLGGMVIPWVAAMVWACMPRGKFTD